MPNVSGSIPTPRSGCVSVVMSDKIFFIGGKNQDGILQDSIYVLQITESKKFPKNFP